MRLAVLTNILTPYRIPLFEALQRRVDDFTVLLMAAQEENRQWKLKPPEFKTRLLSGVHFRPPGRPVSLHWNYGVIRELRRINPDVVISGGFAPANLSAWLYCKLFRKKFIGWGELTLRDGAGSSPVRYALRRWLIGRSDGSIASTREARDAFIHYGAEDHEVLTSLMPIDVDHFHEKTAAFRKTPECRALREKYAVRTETGLREAFGPVLLSVGRITRIKGYSELFKIYEYILKKRPDVSLLIVGDGPDRTMYEQQARENGWSKVHFAGFMQGDELPRYLAIADLFVFHTLYDPFGAVLSEAMAAGVPVVSSIHAAATGDLVEDGVTGFRIDPGRTEGSAETILEALRIPHEEKAAMVEAAYRRVRQLDMETSVESIIRFVESVSDSRKDRPGILVIGPTPPPHHGVSVAMGALLNSGIREQFHVSHLDLADRRGIRHVDKPDVHDVFLFIRQWIRFFRVFVQERPGMVYLPISQTTIGFLRDSFFIWPAILFRSRVILHLHGGNFRDWYEGRGRLVKSYVRALLKRTARMIVLGESFRDLFKDLLPSERISVVPNGVPWTDPKGTPCKTAPGRAGYRILHLSTLSRRKGVFVLLAAIPFVLKKYPDAEFVLAGEWLSGEERREAEVFVEKEGLNGSVVFTGHVEGIEKAALVKSADLFVFPGIQQEGQPLVVLEAMAAGLPVLFTDRGCIGETVIDGENGLKVEIGNPRDLAQKILRLLDHPERMQTMGKQSRFRYEAYYTDAHFRKKMTEVLLQVWEERR